VTVTNDAPVDIVLPSAGGEFRISGDYFFGPQSQAGGGGTWGLFRVTPSVAVIHKAELDVAGGTTTISGHVMEFGMADAKNAAGAAASITIEKVDAAGKAVRVGVASVDRVTGTWTLAAPAGQLAAGDTIRVTSSQGATYSTTVRAADDVAPSQVPVPTASQNQNPNQNQNP
jgi:hypothetical protein